MRFVNLFYDDFFESNIFDDFNILNNAYMFLILLSMIIYNTYADYYLKGVTLGKKIVGISLSKEGGTSDFKFVFAHSCTKVAVSVIWPITLILYLRTGKMPYDKWLEIDIVKTHLI